jgi:3-deoxy-7-phosphoheptulonate synthase
VAIGADGMIVEVHPHPEKAYSDGAQSLDPKQYARMMKDLEPFVELWKQSRMTETVATV